MSSKLLKALLVKKRVKVADSIKFPSQPDAIKFKTWWAAARTEIASAVQDETMHDKAVRWFQEVEKPTTPFEALENSGNRFKLLDVRIASGIMKIATGTLGRELNKANQASAKAGMVLRGRQALHIMFHYFKVNEDQGALYDLKDLMAVKFHGSLQDFINNWETILNGMEAEPDEKTLRTLFYDEIFDCKELDHDMACYDRMEPNDPNRSYKWMLSRIRTLLERKRKVSQRNEVTRHIGRNRRGDAAPVTREHRGRPRGHSGGSHRGSRHGSV